MSWQKIDLCESLKARLASAVICAMKTSPKYCRGVPEQGTLPPTCSERLARAALRVLLDATSAALCEDDVLSRRLVHGKYTFSKSKKPLSARYGKNLYLSQGNKHPSIQLVSFYGVMKGPEPPGESRVHPHHTADMPNKRPFALIFTPKVNSELQIHPPTPALLPPAPIHVFWTVGGSWRTWRENNMQLHTEKPPGRRGPWTLDLLATRRQCCDFPLWNTLSTNLPGEHWMAL